MDWGLNDADKDGRENANKVRLKHSLADVLCPLPGPRFQVF